MTVFDVFGVFSELTDSISITIENELPPGFDLITPEEAKLSTSIGQTFELVGEGVDRIYSHDLYLTSELENEIESSTDSLYVIAANSLVNGENYTLKSKLETSTGYGYEEYAFQTSQAVNVDAAVIEIAPEDSEIGYHNANMIISHSGFVDPEGTELTYEYYYDIGYGEVNVGENTSESLTTPFPGAASNGEILIRIIATNAYLQANSKTSSFDLGVIIVLADYSTSASVAETIQFDAASSYKGNYHKLFLNVY
jgi:hypothetical protein